jgi:hypothetical protein
MLRLICINNKPVQHSSGIVSYGSGLKEGEIYTAHDEIKLHPNNGKECYFIIELSDLKLVSRFIPVSEVDETELVNTTEKAETVT